MRQQPVHYACPRCFALQNHFVLEAIASFGGDETTEHDEQFMQDLTRAADERLFRRAIGNGGSQLN